MKAPVKDAADTAQATVHKVEAGETLSSIAKKYFGTNGPKTIALSHRRQQRPGSRQTENRTGIGIPAKK